MRLLPPLVVLVVADSLAMAWGVSAVECLTYGLYLGFVVALPGWVLWRLAGPTLTHSAEELALGVGWSGARLRCGRTTA